MTDQVRFEHAERVRDFYRNQGRDVELKRVLAVLDLEYHKMLDAGHKAHVAGLDYAIRVLKGESE
jgi:hypothetical protein